MNSTTYRLSTRVSFRFDVSDDGVYQCIFIDNNLMELFIGSPMRLDYGKGGGGGVLSLKQVVLYSIAIALSILYIGMTQISHRENTLRMKP